MAQRYFKIRCRREAVWFNLDDLEKKLSPNAEPIFWVLYILVPIITGILAYNWLPNEVYNPEHHELIASHQISDDEGRTGTVYDVWKDKKTRRIFRLEDFEEHRRSESVRMTYTWFMYGLLGCAFFAFRQSRIAGKKFTVALAQAMAVNLAVALFTYIGLEATNDRILP
jgi:membrane associated rhomboid family serine protease